MANELVAVVEVPVVRAVAFVPRRTPEVRVVADTVEIAIVAAFARRQYPEAVGISSVAATIPPTGGFEFYTSGAVPTYCG